MKILGLTGRVGSGKNEVAKVLQKLGAVILDVDALGHEILDQADHKRQSNQTLPVDPKSVENQKDIEKIGFNTADGKKRQ